MRGIARGAVSIASSIAIVLLAGCTSGSSDNSASEPEPTEQASPAETIASPSDADGSPIPDSELTGTILFSRGGGKYGDETVFVANADGTSIERITPFGKQCCPRWHPDGKHILISALSPDDRITTGIIEADGSGMEKIPLPAGGLSLQCSEAFSEATGQLGCEGFSDEDRRATGAYLIDGTDGGGVVQLTRSHGEADIPFGFSADGSRVYFFRADDRMPNTIDEPVGSLFVIDVDGTHEEQITPSDIPVQKTGTPGGRLSPDGRSIVFASEGEIWKIGTDGSGLEKVFGDLERGYAITPTWSPNGRLIMFALDEPGTLPILDVAPPSGLYVVRDDGSDLTEILVGDEWTKEPDWID